MQDRAQRRRPAPARPSVRQPLAGLAPAALTLVAACAAGLAPAFGAQDDEPLVVGPGAAPVDTFHPDRATVQDPLFGGRVIVHSASLPKHVNYVTENSSYTRRMLYEVHETLMLEDWEYHDFRPLAAESVVVEDMLVLSDPSGLPGVVDVRVKNPDTTEGAPTWVAAKALYGEVAENGATYVVTPRSKGSALGETVTVPAEKVDRLERGAVFNFTLREGVRWHDSQVSADYQAKGPQFLDAKDVYFSWSVYANPHVDCDEKRFQFEKITGCEIVDERSVRFFYEGQYAFALSAIGRSMTLLPSHVYDLSDPDNPGHKARFTLEEQGEHINSNPHNQLWVGIGPYRITHWSDEYVEAQRFADANGKCLYFDREHAGYVDTIRWRVISDDETAMNALLNGELDFFERVKSDDYFGERTATDVFTKNFYKGFKYLGTYGYTGFNLFRPALQDVNVRRAIELAFDFETYRQTNYKGLANRVTGPFPYNSAAYDHSVQARPYDVDAALDLLDENGWYDRNGDGTRDKNGVELKISFLYPAGNDASKNFGLKLQESLAELEIRLDLEQMEWATFLDRLKKRDFDTCNLAWVPELESDPEQLWHSKWGKEDVESSNHSGVMDPVLDEMILRGQRELDFDARMAIWHEMHGHIYREIVPYLFMYNVPNKFAMSRRLRGFQAVKIDPGYIIRRWHFVDPTEPGTRTTLDR